GGVAAVNGWVVCSKAWMTGTRPGMTTWVSLMNLRLGDLSRALQKIEVATFIRLADMLRIHCAVAARVARRRWRPGGAAAFKLLIAYVQMDAARRDVDLDLVAGLDQSERRADEA